METELETVLSRENKLKAWQRVVENGGSAGVDRKSIQETDEHLKQHWLKIYDKLLSGDYKPAAVLSVEIPKADGGIRRLGNSTVQDRLIQQAMHQVLSEVFENGEPHENSSDIRTGIFGQATGGENHPQSNRDLVGICKKQRL